MKSYEIFMEQKTDLYEELKKSIKYIDNTKIH